MENIIKVMTRLITASPRGFGCSTASPRGFGCDSESPRGLLSFLFIFMCFGLFAQTEGKYEVSIAKNIKLHFPNATMTKSQPTYGMRYYTIEIPSPPITGATNGTILNGPNVELGGLLIKNTVINQNGFNLSFNGIGNYGIGLSSPTEKLHVNGNIRFQGLLMPNGNAGTLGQVLVSQGLATPIWQTLPSGWSLLGNTGTVQATNFVGTTDNVGLSFRTNNVIRQTITNDGNVGIGVFTPNTIDAILSIKSVDKTVVLAAARNFPATIHLNNPNDAVGSEQNILFTASYSGFNSPNLGACGSIGTIREVNGLGANYMQSSLVFRTSGSTIASLNTEKMRITGIGNVGIGTTTPNSTIHVNGSVSETVRVVTATTTLTNTDHKIVVQNGATAITITLPPPLTVLGRTYVISRYAGSTGSITLTTSSGSLQARNGTVGATTNIGLHSAAGFGLSHSFTAVNIGGVGVWVRI